MRLDIIEFRREIVNLPQTIEVDEATEVEVKVAKKDPATGELTIETRLEPRMTKKTVSRLVQQEREYVEYAAPGRRSYATTVKTIGEIEGIRDAEAGEEDNDDKVAEAQKRDIILEAYDAWKTGHAMPTHGTPLGAWPAISSKTAEMFKMSGVRTVEEIAELTESAKSRVAHIGDIASLMKQAKLFLGSADKLATANSMKALEDQNTELQDQIKDQRAALEDMRAMLLEMKAAEDVKPRRGRPPKELIEDAA